VAQGGVTFDCSLAGLGDRNMDDFARPPVSTVLSRRRTRPETQSSHGGGKRRQVMICWLR